MTDTARTSGNALPPTSSPSEDTGRRIESPASGTFSSNKSSKVQRANVPAWERELSLVAGAALGLIALRKPAHPSTLGLLGVGAMLLYRGWTGTCPIYKTLRIQRIDQNAPSTEAENYSSHGIHVECAVNINRPAADLYAYWRNLENLPRFMKYLQDVKLIDAQRSHWVAQAPLGMTVQWDAEIIVDEPGSKLAWRSVGSADVDNSGSVSFRPSGDHSGTVVKVVFDYIPPAGQVGAWVSRMLGDDPEHQVKEDLRRFKQLMETGEVTTNASAQPRGMCSR